LLLAATVVLVVPVAVFTLECLIAVRHPHSARRRIAFAAGVPRPRIAVVIPAHNEELGIGETVAALAPELMPADTVLVVADNCTDATAAIALRAGARVLTRNDPDRRGKGYALDFAVRHLRQDPPAVVVFIDADCRLSASALNLLGGIALETGRPVQSRYEMIDPAGAGRHSVAAFAWLVRGTVRPTGLAAMGMPCQLYGTGMAFPWPLLQQLSLASGDIVEDMKLTVDLIGQGKLPIFCSNVSVTSSFAAAPDSAHAQRRRWEHGHLATLLKYGIPAIARSIVSLDIRDTMLALDICVPPLSLLVLLLLAGTGLSLVAMPFVDAGAYAFGVCVVAWLGLFVSIGLAARRFARGSFNLRSLMRIPAYVASKVPLYLKFVTDRQKAWNRADRK
jgi:glycosyltransferase involved in cell wall biosynthesis